MMNIDDLLRITRDEIGRKDLHVASQNNEINFVMFDQFTLAMLRFGFVFLAHWNYVIRNCVKIGVALRVGMIADDQRNFAFQFAVALAV
jgi:hypothetical protein